VCISMEYLYWILHSLFQNDVLCRISSHKSERGLYNASSGKVIIFITAVCCGMINEIVYYRALELKVTICIHVFFSCFLFWVIGSTPFKFAHDSTPVSTHEYIHGLC